MFAVIHCIILQCFAWDRRIPYVHWLCWIIANIFDKSYSVFRIWPPIPYHRHQQSSIFVEKKSNFSPTNVSVLRWRSPWLTSKPEKKPPALQKNYQRSKMKIWNLFSWSILEYFFGGLECVGSSFACVAHLWFLRGVWIHPDNTLPSVNQFEFASGTVLQD